MLIIFLTFIQRYSDISILRKKRISYLYILVRYGKAKLKLLRKRNDKISMCIKYSLYLLVIL